MLPTRRIIKKNLKKFISDNCNPKTYISKVGKANFLVNRPFQATFASYIFVSLDSIFHFMAPFFFDYWWCILNKKE